MTFMIWVKWLVKSFQNECLWNYGMGQVDYSNWSHIDWFIIDRWLLVTVLKKHLYFHLSLIFVFLFGCGWFWIFFCAGRAVFCGSGVRRRWHIFCDRKYLDYKKPGFLILTLIYTFGNSVQNFASLCVFLLCYAVSQKNASV